MFGTDGGWGFGMGLGMWAFWILLIAIIRPDGLETIEAKLFITENIIK